MSQSPTRYNYTASYLCGLALLRSRSSMENFTSTPRSTLVSGSACRG